MAKLSDDEIVDGMTLVRYMKLDSKGKHAVIREISAQQDRMERERHEQRVAWMEARRDD